MWKCENVKFKNVRIKGKINQLRIMNYMFCTAGDIEIRIVKRIRKILHLWINILRE